MKARKGLKKISNFKRISNPAKIILGVLKPLASVKNAKLLLVVLITGLFVFALQEFRYKKDGSLLGISTQNEATQSAQAQPGDNPQADADLKEILESTSQDVRLKAARRLVEKVDVEKALEILEHSTLPHTGEGHLVVHQIGFYAYQKYGVDSILKCKDYFLYACYHGAIIEAASDQGFDAIRQMTDKCKASPVRYFQCVHAAGHSILAIWNYDLPEALQTCDGIYEKDTQFPEALSSCHNGVFMENLFGVHDWGTENQPKREWLSDDPYFPCNALEEKYRAFCWQYQSSYFALIQNQDFTKVAQMCLQIPKEYHDNCFKTIGTNQVGFTPSMEVMRDNCNKMPSEHFQNICVTGVISSFAYRFVGDVGKMIDFCSKVSGAGKEGCYKQIGTSFLDWDSNKDLAKQNCQKIPDQKGSSWCLSTL